MKQEVQVDAISGYMKRKKAPLFSNLIQAPYKNRRLRATKQYKTNNRRSLELQEFQIHLLNKINQAVQ